MTVSDITPKIAEREATSQPAVTIYTTRTCTVCPGVIEHIRKRGYDPEIVHADEDDAAFYFINKTLDHQQVPVVYVSKPSGDVHWSGRGWAEIVEHLPKVAA